MPVGCDARMRLHFRLPGHKKRASELRGMDCTPDDGGIFKDLLIVASRAEDHREHGNTDHRESFNHGISSFF